MHIRANKIAVTLTAVLFAAFWWLASFHRDPHQYPHIVVAMPDDLEVTFLLNPQPQKAGCQLTLGTLTAAIQTSCPNCRVKERQCLKSLSDAQQDYFSSRPLSVPSTRLPNGIAAYTAQRPEIALAACQEAARHAAASNSGPKISCSPADAERPAATSRDKLTTSHLLLTLILLAAAGLATWATCYLIVRYEHLHAHLSHDHLDAGPQKFHATPTPRIGGLAVMAGLLCAGSALFVLKPELDTEIFGSLLVAGTAAFAGGIIEDITKKVGVLTRLLLTMLSGAMGSWLLGATLNGLGVPWLDSAFVWLPFAVLFTAFAVGGIANSVNIIDGYNGLAGGYGVITLVAMALVAAFAGDPLIFVFALTTAGSLVGFLCWNYPNGKIFLGDGGAYLLGFLLAEFAVLLVARNPGVSPWCPMLLLIYPVFETLFSVYRRKWLRNSHPGHPDALHLHQLIFRRVIRLHIGCKGHAELTYRNSLVAPYIWWASACIAALAVTAYQSTPTLILGGLVSCLTYVYVYRRITTWSVPDWALRRSTPKAQDQTS